MSGEVVCVVCQRVDYGKGGGRVGNDFEVIVLFPLTVALVTRISHCEKYTDWNSVTEID